MKKYIFKAEITEHIFAVSEFEAQEKLRDIYADTSHFDLSDVVDV
jgi:hypothetical protein